MQFRRRREKKTDYAQRLVLLKSDKARLVVRRSNSGFRLQIVLFEPTGDKTVAEVTSVMLKKYGWKGHCGNLSAAYLTGILIGKEAEKKHIKEVVPDLGLQMSVKGSSLYACLVGARDAGLKVPMGKEVIPSKERIEGRHVASYAESLKSKDQQGYSKRFSAYLKQNLPPEKIPEHVEHVKQAILSSHKEV